MKCRSRGHLRSLRQAQIGHALLRTTDYDIVGFRPVDPVRLDILVHKNRVDALSIIVHRQFADQRGRKLVKAAARSIDTCSRSRFKRRSAAGSSPARRPRDEKDVTAKCYGGDITQRKLWSKQAAKSG
jgi:GTP-binding protein LepA